MAVAPRKSRKAETERQIALVRGTAPGLGCVMDTHSSIGRAFVEQGEGRFWFVNSNVRVNAIKGTCSCRSDWDSNRQPPECGHVTAARALMLIHGPITDEGIRDLASILMAEQDGFEVLMRPGPSDIRDMFGNEVMRRLKDLVGYCWRCGRWRSYWDMSEDVEDVCLECVR